MSKCTPGALAHTVVSKARHDYATGIYDACVGGVGARPGTIASANTTWFPILQQAVKASQREGLPKVDLVAALAAAFIHVGIEWVPGLATGRVTCRNIVRLVGQKSMPFHVLTAPRGSLKRSAWEAEHRLSQPATKQKRPDVINFGSQLPFRTMPTLLEEGFKEMYRIFKDKKDLSKRAHYLFAQQRLTAHLGEPLVDLMLMIALTLAACSEVPDVVQMEDGTVRFGVSKNKKKAANFAVAVVLRMMWFLWPTVFEWKKDVLSRTGAMSIPDMTKAVGKC